MKNTPQFFVLALTSIVTAPAVAAVFFAAHPDDIVLMMGRSAQAEIRADLPTVLVILTAGDGGNGSAPVALAGLGARYYNQMGNPYYRVRHNAHEAAIATWVPAVHLKIAQRSNENFGADVNAVEKVRIGKVVIYNLNLPDGTLERLQAGSLATLNDVTGLNHYTLGEFARDAAPDCEPARQRERRAQLASTRTHTVVFRARI